MPPPAVTDFTKITDETITWGAPKKNSYHGLSVPIRYQGKDGREIPIIVQSPVLRAPFGVSDETGEYGRKVDISLSFPGYDPHVEQTAHGEMQVIPAWAEDREGVQMKQFYDFITSWDSRNKQRAVENSQMWFGKKISPVVIDELFKMGVKQSSEPAKYSPTFKVKVPVSGKKGEQVPSDEFYDTSGTKIGFEAMKASARGAKVIALFKVTGLWFAGKSFGLNFQMVQMMRIENDKFDGCAITIPAALCTPVDPPVNDDEEGNSLINFAASTGSTKQERDSSNITPGNTMKKARFAISAS